MRLELSRRGDYAVRAALAVAILDDGQPVSARRIAERMHIPARFLAHVLADLVPAQLVIGTRGRGGGYRLARPAGAISLLEVADAVEDDGASSRCVLRGGRCRTDGTCAVHDAFYAASVAMRGELRAATLEGLAAADAN
ncbi:MAG: Rrf2 family transcriptional regulator [Candidatus Limnocylindrales bacterium]